MKIAKLPLELALIAIIAILLSLNIDVKKHKVIDLPEEIGLAKPGDSLKVLRVTADSIIIGFNNKRNN